MPIVETKISTRPNITIPFYNATNNALIVALKSATGPEYTVAETTDTYKKTIATSGTHIVERIYSEDQLTETVKKTFNSLADWSHHDTNLSIEIDNSYLEYTTTNGFSQLESNQYTLTGIDAPFTCTTTYNYIQDQVPPEFDSFIVVIEVASVNLISLVNTGTQLISVCEYANSTDFTTNHWRDFQYIPMLHAGGVTRTIQYALL
jgi:hypothetical protein